MKFSIAPFSIDKAYSEKIRRKMGAFQAATGTKKALFLTMITTYGLAPGMYAGLAQQDLTMEALFREG